MTPAEVAAQLPLRQFLDLCVSVDALTKIPESKFDVHSIVENPKYFEVYVAVTGNQGECRTMLVVKKAGAA